MKDKGFVERLTCLISALLRLLAPPKCIICHSLLEDESELCPSCAGDFEAAQRRRCPICHKSARGCSCRPRSMFETTDTGESCILALAFLGAPESTDRRDIAVRRMVYSLKHAEDRSSVRFTARLLSHELLRLFARENLNLGEYKITYPPRSRSQVHKYGFDQSRQLARMISRYTGIPFVCCFRRRGDKMQKTLKAAAREKNAGESYEAILPDATGKFIIADDVITTGATVDACAALLRAGGAAQVFPVCIARTKHRKRPVRRSPSRSPWFAAAGSASKPGHGHRLPSK